MKKLDEEKELYNNIAIPEELSARINKEIAKSRAHHTKRKSPTPTRILKGVLLTAASLLIIFVVGLNTNKAFALGTGNLPGIGAIAKVFTFRSYELEKEDLKVTVDIPQIEIVSENSNNASFDVNAEIQALCEDYVLRAQQETENYKQSFLETGGTHEEWVAHDITIRVLYEVKTHTEEYLSVVIIGTMNWSDAYNEIRYYNFDLNTGKLITLETVLGHDYAALSEESILAQINAQIMEGEIYWPENWNGIDENTLFYMSEDGYPVIVLPKYDIAPGSLGTLEFKITPVIETHEAESGDNTNSADSEYYDDNFAVSNATAKEYAQSIQSAVLQKDLEGLADLTRFPVYIGFKDNGTVIETREDFIVLGNDAVFTDDMLDSMANANINDISASNAGFYLSSEIGAPSITFSVQDGKLGISGINY